MGEFPASKVNLQLATWLTGTFHSRRMSTEYLPVWGVVIGPHWDLQYRAGGGGGGGGGLGGVEYQNGKWVWPKGEIHPFSRGGGRGLGQITHNSSRHQIPVDTLNCLFPSNTFIPSTYSFFHSPASQSLPEERIFLVTDLLGAPEWCRLRYDTCTTHNVDSIPKFYTARQ